MSLVRVAIRVCLVVSMLFGGSAAMAGPARCSVNNQDSTCVGTITTGWQTAPTCPSSAGWTMITPAKWIGSQYSAPQCNYQNPPTCPGGFHETVPASWNGSNWVGQQCQPNATQATDVANACNAHIPSGYYPTSAWSQDTDPQKRAYDDYVAAYTGGVAGYSTVYSLGADGPTYSLPCYDRNNYLGRCYVASDSSVIAIIMSQASSASSGQCNH